MLGKDAVYVPGWDCHGLPIEWQIEQRYRKEGLDKDAVPIAEFRQECRDFAEHWIDVQRSEFQRLGVIGDWDHPYTTMAYAAEAGIFRELAKFLLSGQLYRGKKSVMWSVVEKTALADAEVEYHDHTSTTITVRFPVVRASHPALDGASAVIWTTTPWTIPGNRAVAYGERVDYRVIEVEAVGEGALARVGERLLVAAALQDEFAGASGITRCRTVAELKGAELAGTTVRHPLHGRGYEIEGPLLAGDFVTTEQGTGLVHIAPSHGADDFELGARHGLEVPDTVGEDGLYAADLPLFGGLHVFKAAEPVIEALRANGALLAQGRLVHSYPHSWRSKAPLIFRATPQWFIPMEGPGALRAKALAAIDATRWVPAQGRNRIRGMVESRPDWCVSRQRAWGVPIALFVDKASGEVLRDPEVVERIAAAFEQEGADAWFTGDPARFLGPGRDPADFEQVMDIVEVWFDSGSTHATVLEQRDDLLWPASLYLEGSDQHRGWFQSSLLESCGTRGRAPYETVLTHGFVVDAEGRKMSKSLGNVISPLDLIKTGGADILRLWTVHTDYSEDVRIGQEILAGQGDAYRRLRNSLRYLLGNLAGFGEAERVPHAQMPELERWVLHRLAGLDRLVREANEDFEFARLYSSLHNFCATDLSAFYFDVRKDVLYCDRSRQHAAPRRAHRARPPVPLSDGMAGAGAGVHRRGSLADPLSGRGRQRASAPVPGGARRLARSGSGRPVGADPPGAPGGDRRARGGAAREADRRQSRGSTASVRRRGRCPAAGDGRPRRARDHERHRGDHGRAAGRRLHPGRYTGRRRRAEARRRDAMCPLLAELRHGRRRRPVRPLRRCRRRAGGLIDDRRCP